MRVLFDTNVLLDALLAREPFADDAAFLLRMSITLLVGKPKIQQLLLLLSPNY